MIFFVDSDFFLARHLKRIKRRTINIFYFWFRRDELVENGTRDNLIGMLISAHTKPCLKVIFNLSMDNKGFITGGGVDKSEASF